MTDLENLAGISEEQAKKNGISIVGHMIAFTMGECAIPNDIPQKYWEENGLEKSFIPNPSKPKGAFKKACSSMKGYKEEEGIAFGFKHYSLYAVTKLTDTQYMITRKIIKVSEENQEETELEHYNLMKLHFDKDRNEIFYDLEDSSQVKVAEDLFNNTIKPKYEQFLSHMTRENIHDAFKRYLKNRNAVSLTIGNGGAWFIPTGYESEFEKIKRFYNEIADKYITGDYHIKIRNIPMVNTLDVKEMVEDGVRKKVEIEMQNIVKDTINRLNSIEGEELIEKALKLTETKVENTAEFKKTYEKLLNKRIAVDINIPDGIPQSERLKAIAEAMTR